MSFRGDISSLGLGDVVQNLDVNKKTGTLAIRAGERDVWIQFEGGLVVSYLDSEGMDFAAWLVEKGLVDDDDMAVALKRHRRSKRRILGDVLQKLGYLDRDTYASHRQSIVHDRLCEALTLGKGEFTFFEGDVDPQHADPECRVLGMKLSAQNLIMEAARRSDDWSHIRKHLPSESEVYFASPSERERIAESAEDDIRVEAAELFDGTRTVRQVISRLPYSRFDALRCVADLVAERKIRPADSDRILEQADSAADPAEAIARLETVLEREPGNMEILSRLATLCEGRQDLAGGSKYHKIIANTHLDSGDLESARKRLEAALDLNPGDVTVWRKLWTTVVAIGDRDRTLDFGRRYVEQFREFGVLEEVRDALAELVRLFPGKEKLRVEHAEVCLALGDRKTGITELYDIGQEHLRRKKYDDAERIFATVLRQEPENERVKRLIREIQSGRLERRRAFRRRLLREAGVCAVIVLGGWLTLRELACQNELLGVFRTVLAEPMLERGHYEEAERRIEAVRGRFPFSFSASQQGGALLESMRHKLPERLDDESTEEDLPPAPSGPVPRDSHWRQGGDSR